MRLTLAIPFFNQLSDVKGIMALLKFVTSDDVEWLIIDNGSSDPVEAFFRNVLRPKRLNFVRNEVNLGMVKTYNQIFDLTTTELVAVLHNDVFIYEKNWDRRVIKTFQSIESLGSLGFFGASGCGHFGERLQDVEKQGQMSGISNLLEAEQHGIRLRDDYLAAAILDGFAMVFNLEMIIKGGGLDPKYQFHHLYDRELPLMSLSLGYKNVVLNVPCHHQSGLTANRPGYQKWINTATGKQAGDSFTHDQNSKYFKKKWAHALPLYINPDFTFRTGAFFHFPLKGDAILKSQVRLRKTAILPLS